LAFADVNQRDIYILDLSRRTSSRFTSGSGSETSPVWFPDGTKIAYRHDEGGLFEKDVNGTGPERRLLEEIVAGPTQVSPDGKWILYFTSGGNPGVYLVSTTGDGKPQLVVPPPFGGVEPQLSQDGRWLAYASNENTGRPEVYVQAFPSTGKRWPVSNNGGRQPLWRDDGKELYFVSDDRKFYAVAVSESSGSLVLGVPEFLFDMRANVSYARNSYIPSHDGKRFLVNMLLDADDAPINVVYNWRTALK
jgi:Tol biopolymer transport system component